MPAETITATFNQLLAGLKPLITKIEACQTKPNTKILNQPYQLRPTQITQLITQTLGLTPFHRRLWRVDETEHPFTTGYYDERAYTNHYYPQYFAVQFLVLHESGHALTSKTLTNAISTVGSSCSYGIPRIPNLIYENIIVVQENSGLVSAKNQERPSRVETISS